tara:strand:- start:21836 stop:22567 length:732 start_codon:yes stop_codon:yes gene_type:complete
MKHPVSRRTRFKQPIPAVVAALLLGILCQPASAQEDTGTGSKLKFNSLPKPSGFFPEVKGARRAGPEDKDAMKLRTLSPKNGAPATISTRPRLFWYQSKPSDGNLVVVLRDRNTRRIDPSILVRDALSAGTQALDLPSEIELKPGEIYIWTITYKPSPNILEDVVARGEIFVMNEAGKLRAEAEKLEAGEPRILFYASNGAWYDVLREIQDLRQKNSEISEELQSLWEEVLKQGGISGEDTEP